VFYETGYELPVMRQASRRAWRLQQPRECKVFCMFYEKTMQEKAMELMGKKLLAAEALEGKFSSEGLVAMAKSLAENMEESPNTNWQARANCGAPSKQVVLTRMSFGREDTVIE
jgi:hypothetical protein